MATKEDAAYEALSKEAYAVVKPAAAKIRNAEYGYKDGTTVDEGGFRGYKAEDVDEDQIPLSYDLVRFVLWLRDQKFLAGLDLEKLGDLVMDYTGE